MNPRRRPAAVLAALVLALSPAAAFGQSAGDDQYEDPFAGEEETAQATPTPSPVTSDPGFEEEDPAPAEPAPAEPSQEESVEEPAPVADGDELPRTGADAGLVALFGAGFVLTGVGLRLRLRDGAARS